MQKKKDKNRIKSNAPKDKCVYIVLSKTQTLPSNVIKMWTREPYSHTSLAFDIELNEMYSFARKHVNFPFYCGFITEDITTGVFGRDVKTECRVMRLWVTTAQKKRIDRILDKFKAERNMYRYNYLGVFSSILGRSVERRYNYFCSQFVYSVLERAGVDVFVKKPGLVRPRDFRLWREPEIIYEGRLNQYRNFLKDHYPKDPGTGEYIEEPGINQRTIEVFKSQRTQDMSDIGYAEGE